MLLAIDVGNTNTVLGLFEPGRLVSSYRLETRRSRPGDEYASSLETLMRMDPALADARAGCATTLGLIDGVIIVSVVPQTRLPLEHFAERWLGRRSIEVGRDLTPDMPVLTKTPGEVGADRIVNAIAAYHEHPQGLLIIDLGTATTFDVVSPKGEFLGGAIAPGLGLGADALVAAASKLPRVDLTRPDAALGKTTREAMQSGLFFGYVGLIEGLIARLTAELDFPALVLATGGLAPVIARESKRIDLADQSLTLRGLELIHRRMAP